MSALYFDQISLPLTTIKNNSKILFSILNYVHEGCQKAFILKSYYPFTFNHFRHEHMYTHSHTHMPTHTQNDQKPTFQKLRIFA